MPRSSSDRQWLVWSYALAPLLTALAFFLRLRLANSESPVLLVMLLPVLIVAYRGGLGPGIFCTILSGAASAYYLLEPIRSSRIPNALNQLDWFVLIASGVLVSALSESGIRARRRSEAAKTRLIDQMLLLNQTYDGVLIWEWNGPITVWNAAAETLYGYSEKEAVGRMSHDLLATEAPDGFDSVLREIERDGVWEGHLRHHTKDGRSLVVQSRMLLVREPRRWFVVEANRDVTGSLQAQLEIARGQQRFETAFRISPLGKLVVRLANDRIVEVNQSYAKLIGVANSEIAGKSLTEHSPLVDNQILAQIRQSLAEGRPVTGIDVRFRRKNGDMGAGVLYAEVLQAPPDQHALVVLNDVTTHQRAEDRLRLANYDLQQFAYAAAHDLQEPIRNIATALGLVNRNYRSILDAEGVELITESITAAKRISQMIRDLLAFTQADPEATRVNSRADAKEALRHVTANLKIMLEECDGEVAATDLPVLQVHPTHLLQLFQNLIGNALKYRAEGIPPRVRVEARLDGSTWTFSIADNGIGFDSAFREQIFGVFKRLHSAPEYSGNGMGLAICERIVRLYGGRIWAESAPGQGATFLFTLPVADFEAATTPSAMHTTG